MNKDGKITKVEVIDKENNVLISMNYNKIEYDKKFDKEYFKLNSIIKLNTKDDNIENDNTTNTNKKEETEKNINDNTNDKDNNNDTPENNTNIENSTNSNNNQETNQTNNANNITSNDEELSSNKNNSSTEEQTKQTATIDDVIYPMFLPDNTYLTSQEKISTNDGERLILTFGGDKSFVLVEETITNDNSNIVIPVNGEFDFLTDVIGVINTNSIMWHSNGIEYYITSETLETSVLIDIARSISVLPVSK